MIRQGLIAAAVLALLAGPAGAHHSFAMFDGAKRIKIEGVVKEFQWSNPHVFIQLMAPDATGKQVEWSIECPAISGLVRAGWSSRALKPGDKLVAEIHPLRAGGPGGALYQVTLADGRTLAQTAIQRFRAGEGGPPGGPPAGALTGGARP